MVAYELDDVSAITIVWTVSNVTCPILAVQSLVAGGFLVKFGPAGSALKRTSGEGVVRLIPQGRVPWLRLRPLPASQPACVYVSAAMSFPEYSDEDGSFTVSASADPPRMQSAPVEAQSSGEAKAAGGVPRPSMFSPAERAEQDATRIPFRS